MNSRLSIVHRNLPRQIRYGALGRSVRDVVPPADEPEDGRDVDDPAAIT